MSQNTKTVYHQWIEAWNGKLELINEIVDPNFVFHPTHNQPDQPDFNGQDGIRRMIEMSRQPFSSLAFKTDIGPIAEGEFVVARWQGRGVYKGGLPGATAAKGTKVSFSAIDILRVRNGKIIEYWHNADDLNFMLQVGAVEYTTSKQ